MNEIKDVLANMRTSPRYKKITDEEYQELKLKQFQKVREQEQETAKQRRLENMENLGITQDHLSLTWDSVRPGISDGHRAMIEVRKQYNAGHGFIFLWGTYGQAKTLIGKIMIAQAFRDGKKCAYANMSAVLDDIRLAFDSQHQSTELVRKMDYWNNRDVLFLDELDKVNNTDWATQQIFSLLDTRYQKAIREEAFTVIASNTANQKLDGYLNSRLKDKRLGPVMHLNGQDGRLFMPDNWRY